MSIDVSYLGWRLTCSRLHESPASFLRCGLEDKVDSLVGFASIIADCIRSWAIRFVFRYLLLPWVWLALDFRLRDVALYFDREPWPSFEECSAGFHCGYNFTSEVIFSWGESDSNCKELCSSTTVSNWDKGDVRISRSSSLSVSGAESLIWSETPNLRLRSPSAGDWTTVSTSLDDGGERMTTACDWGRALTPSEE